MCNSKLVNDSFLGLVAAHCCLFVVSALGQWDEPPQVLPGTRPLTWEDPLDVRMMDGAHRMIERKINASPEVRAAHWNTDLSSPAAYANSVAANRERLRTILGAMNRGVEQNHNIALPSPSAAPDMQRIGDDRCPAVLAENELYDQFGLRDHCDIEFFQGGHTMKGNKTIEFLELHLGPARK